VAIEDINEKSWPFKYVLEIAIYKGSWTTPSNIDKAAPRFEEAIRLIVLSGQGVVLF
jgi:hypothetical protein